MLVFVLIAVVTFVVAAVPYAVCLLCLSVLRLNPPDPPESSFEPTVSVVLPSHNEASIIRRRLENIRDLEYPLEKLEVVVVDSSTDGTADVVRSFFEDVDDLSLVLVREPSRRGVAAAVNEAVSAASGELILRTDCDSRFAPDVVRRGVRHLSDLDVGGVTGRQAEFLAGSEVERDYRGLLTDLQLLENRVDSVFIVHGPCFMFRRDAFKPLPHDTLADDTEIAVRLRRTGRRVAFDPEMRFAEAGTSGFLSRRNRKDRRAMGLLDLLVRHRDAIGRYGLYGRIVLPLNAWMMWISPWAMALGTISTVLFALSFGPIGLSVPVFIVIGFALGQSERLGPLQPLYPVVDSMVSLLVASYKLRHEQDGVWDIDRSSREAFE
ncbi:glycosyltransferase [Halorubrum sp. JWXQ-INN 858]|uniref:glycosyltransferase n=1 Tax=Halorubrum sp. JWXQ-INN 858 TaxID=2690782 RepID=UPI0013597D64|nr:glycosyltransferase [Halorubrum sp. JWXQ-INN 858]MWV64982.1 glycosyltransferase [Halorubrum sp. JWXQ-INN 858]